MAQNLKHLVSDSMPLHMKSVQMYYKILNIGMNLWELSTHLDILNMTKNCQRICGDFIGLPYYPYWATKCISTTNVLCFFWPDRDAVLFRYLWVFRAILLSVSPLPPHPKHSNWPCMPSNVNTTAELILLSSFIAVCLELWDRLALISLWADQFRIFRYFWLILSPISIEILHLNIWQLLPLSGECFCVSTCIFFSWFSLFSHFFFQSVPLPPHPLNLPSIKIDHVCLPM